MPAWLRPVGVAGLAAVAFALFWTFRIRHRFLGDALVMVQTLPSTSEVHPLEPVAMALQRDIYQLAHRGFERPGLEPADVAHLTTALGSAVAGVLFVFTCWGSRAGWSRPPIDRGGAAGRPRTTA